MSIYKKFPFTVVNNYIGDFLAEQDVMPKEVVIGNNTTPAIIPGVQTPELVDAYLTNGEKAPAFIVYGLDIDQHDKPVWGSCESISYTIYSPKFTKIAEIIYAIEDLFSKKDWSAARLSKYSEEKGSKFHFTCVEYELIVGPVPPDEEGGRYGAIVNIHYEYLKPIDGDPSSSNLGMRI